MAFPTLNTIIISIAFLLVGAPIVYLLSKALKLHPKPITIINPRKEATLTFLVIVAVFVVISAKRIVLIPILQYQGIQYSGIVEIVVDAFIAAMAFLPMILAMRRTKQNRGSIGISREYMGRMLVVGFTLTAVLFAAEGFLASSLGGGFAGFSLALVYGFVDFIIGGFYEEIIWRGYIQTRLAAYSGTLKGLVATSMLFTLWHFPVRYYQFSGVPLEALASTLLLFPISLLYGYMMVRCQNIIPSSIFHVFYNWSTIFWQIPTF